jgi:signal transduction histidine kinase
LDVQKLESNGMIFKKKDFDVKKMISELITNFDNQITNKNIDFVISMSSIIIHGDFDRIRQVFLNLIGNAIDFVQSKNGIIEINALEKDDHVLFQVKDNGVGMSNENQKEIFKKFHQTDTSHSREHNGIGLGLVLCKGIVEAHGGRIWCESEINKGTIFNFTIPKR